MSDHKDTSLEPPSGARLAWDAMDSPAQSELAAPTGSESGRPCPKCGKEMSEQKKWSGFWTCPDFKNPINDAPPYKFKCTGMFIEERAAKEFEQTCWEIIQQRN